MENAYFEYIPIDAMNGGSYFGTKNKDANATVALNTDQCVGLLKKNVCAMALDPRLFIERVVQYGE